MLQTEASTSALDNYRDSEDLQPKNESSSLKRRTTANRNIYRTQLVLCSLVLMAMFWCADASFKNYIKAPDELSQGCSPELLHIHSFRHFANLCKEKSHVAIVAYEGLQDSMEACREKMRFQRWDCSQPGTILHEPSLLRYGYRETAYLLAMSAAGAAWGVSTACAHGWLDECKCTQPNEFENDINFDTSEMKNNFESRNRKIVGEATIDDWDWSGCSYGVDYGISTSRKIFTRTGRLNQPIKKLERHNLKAGRLAFKKTLTSTCKCHGISGSCQSKTCWKKTADLRTIVDYLTDRYYNAKQVTRESSKVKNSDLVYLDPSPEICSPYTYEVKQRRSLPRICNWRNETHSIGNCEYLCCGKKEKVIKEPTQVQCDCKLVGFQYRCKQCLQYQYISTCDN